MIEARTDHRVHDRDAVGVPSHELMARAREAAAVIEQEAVAIEASADLTPAVRSSLWKSGLFWMGLPPAVGANADITTTLEIMEEIARADGSTGWSFFCNVVATTGAYGACPDAAITTLFQSGEPAVFCGQFAPLGRAVAVDGGYRISGKHQFASGSSNATWLGAGQMLFDASGKPVLGADGKQLNCVSYFPKEKVRLLGNWNVTGLNGTGSVDYEIPEQFVPAEFVLPGTVLGPEGASHNKRGGSLCRIGNFVMGNVGHAAVALGMAKRALQEIVRITATKRRMGSPDVISQSEMFRYDFAMHEARYWQARGHLLAIAQDVERTRTDGLDISKEQQARVLQMNHQTHRTAKEIVEFANSWAGSETVRNPSVIARIVRDMSVAVNHYIVDRSHVLNAAPTLIELWKPRQVSG